ncbi:MAG: COR domain-containing protein, partial [Ignavibacteria bacterium]|nr:COR domain-containing protein [Ignavibacteria bacterium]
LTKRSLYLFVWEASTDADLISFDYWLNTVQVLSGNSPIIVIQNKIDERKKLINQESWMKKFPNIVEFVDVSAVKDLGIELLKDLIIREIEKLPHIGDVLPKRWMDIRHHLESLKENFISYVQYKKICKKFGMNEDQTILLSGYYHDLGVFLHFKENPILKNTIFLKPHWATNAVYKVIDNTYVKDNRGKFNFDDLSNIWADKKEFPEEKYIELIELMKNFELCFELPHYSEYIIPELLPANQPQFEWSFVDNLRFKYEYTFMPAGVMTRFIVNSHDLIKENFYWKDGVILVRENTEALIIKTDIRNIDIWIRGEQKKSILEIIRRQIDSINSTFSNLNVNQMVPCICQECVKSNEPFFHPYRTLLKAQNKGRKETECKMSFDTVSIEKLLGGIEEKQIQVPTTKIKYIKIFLASSTELKHEREQLEILVGKENKKLIEKNIYIDLIIWEDLKNGFQKGRVQ